MGRLEPGSRSRAEPRPRVGLRQGLTPSSSAISRASSTVGVLEADLAQPADLGPGVEQRSEGSSCSSAARRPRPGTCSGCVGRRRHVLEVREQPSGLQQLERLGEDLALALVLEVVDGHRGDDGSKGPSEGAGRRGRAGRPPAVLAGETLARRGQHDVGEVERDAGRLRAVAQHDRAAGARRRHRGPARGAPAADGRAAPVRPRGGAGTRPRGTGYRSTTSTSVQSSLCMPRFSGGSGKSSRKLGGSPGQLDPGGTRARPCHSTRSASAGAPRMTPSGSRASPRAASSVPSATTVNGSRSRRAERCRGRRPYSVSAQPRRRRRDPRPGGWGRGDRAPAADARTTGSSPGRAT